MSGSASKRATIQELHEIEGQAELIDGRIVRLPFHNVRTAQIVMAIVFSIYDAPPEPHQGEVFMSTLAYVVPRLPSGRKSFCPDASYYAGPAPANPMSFIEGAPDFAVEVRDERDDDPAREQTRIAKRSDDFAAGSLVVWDVDPDDEVVRVYRSNDPSSPVTYARGQIAEAEPAVPGWRIEVDAIFE
jgi:Uma2 family endonuclease